MAAAGISSVVSDAAGREGLGMTAITPPTIAEAAFVSTLLAALGTDLHTGAMQALRAMAEKSD